MHVHPSFRKKSLARVIVVVVCDDGTHTSVTSVWECHARPSIVPQGEPRACHRCRGVCAMRSRTSCVPRTLNVVVVQVRAAPRPPARRGDVRRERVRDPLLRRHARALPGRDGNVSPKDLASQPLRSHRCTGGLPGRDDNVSPKDLASQPLRSHQRCTGGLPPSGATTAAGRST